LKNVTKIEPVKPIMPELKKVAAYARVSMESERLQHSLAAQVSYYSDLIQKHPGWKYAGVYADDGISGTKTTKRDEFNRMLQDCEDGKIDIILTKSISRFARNTVDLLTTVRRLKELGISVRFEKEKIDSLSEDGELMLTLLASFAQEEIRSLSDNVKWGTRKRMEKGIPNGHFTILGYEWEDDHLVIVPEEAAIVRRIYQNFLDGKSRLETERELAAEGITTKKEDSVLLIPTLRSSSRTSPTPATYSCRRNSSRTRLTSSAAKTTVSCRSIMWKTPTSRSSAWRPSSMCRRKWPDEKNSVLWQTKA